MDPPYWGTSQDYAAQFPEADHLRLADNLRRVKGTWLLTYNDAPAVRQAYAACHVSALVSCNAGHGQATDDGRQVLISSRSLLHPPEDAN